ncbi:hypothetical protein [Shimia sp.]|uniref:hypothetical protein n=1 Tax=Shimia sp. TaxID=1954381 RepID=UPI0025D6B492|nr:hypothetical protein [Shimia sp.]
MRSIFLTSLTLAAGLFPMVAFGGTLWGRATAGLIRGGLGVAIVLVLFAVPWLYHVLLK